MWFIMNLTILLYHFYFVNIPLSYNFCFANRLYKLILKATLCLRSSLQNILNLKILIFNVIKKNERLYIIHELNHFFMRYATV